MVVVDAATTRRICRDRIHYDGGVYRRRSNRRKHNNNYRDSSTVHSDRVTASNGTASVQAGGSDLKGAIDYAKSNNSNVVIAPTITGNATNITVDIPKNSVSSIATDTSADLTVKTPVGTVTLPNAALDSITSQAAGSIVTVSLGTVTASALTAEQQAVVNGDIVYDISVLSGTTHISSSAELASRFPLPYTLKAGEDPSNVRVWYLNDAGGASADDLHIRTKTRDSPHSKRRICPTMSWAIEAAWINPFEDVKSPNGSMTPRNMSPRTA